MHYTYTPIDPRDLHWSDNSGVHPDEHEYAVPTDVGSDGRFTGYIPAEYVQPNIVFSFEVRAKNKVDWGLYSSPITSHCP